MSAALHTLLCLAALASQVVWAANDSGYVHTSTRIASLNGSITLTRPATVDTSTTLDSGSTSPSIVNGATDLSKWTPSGPNSTAARETPQLRLSTEDNGALSGVNLGSITTLSRPSLTTPSSSPSGNGPSLSPTEPPITTSISSLQTTSTVQVISSFRIANTTGRPWTNSTGNYSIPGPSITTVTVLPTIVTTPATTSAEECTSGSDGLVTITSYSVVHTWTTTLTGSATHYTPPFPTLSTPVPCTPAPEATGRFTLSMCDSSGESCSFIHTGDPVTSTNAPPTLTIGRPGTISDLETTSTLIVTTTDKNPAVVFSPITTPSYGGPAPTAPFDHDVGTADGSLDTPAYGMVTSYVETTKAAPVPTEGPGPAATPVTVAVRPNEVVLNDQTYTDDPKQRTSTVVVGTETFVIYPSKVAGAGATITRPAGTEGGVFVSTLVSSPMTTTIDGLEIVYGSPAMGTDDGGPVSSVATIDGTAFTIGPTPTTVTVKGHNIMLGPGGIIFSSQTLPVVAAPGTTEVAVLGAELITAIGSDKVVIEGRTRTYGPGSGTVTEIVGGDTVLIGPGGVMVNGETSIGGVTAAPTATAFELVGGVTITKIGSTAVVMAGHTYRVGPGATPTTTVIDGETVTVGPQGVAISTWTLDAPYASTTTILPAHNVANTAPAADAGSAASATRSPHNEGPSLSSDWKLVFVISCIAAGVGVWEI